MLILVDFCGCKNEILVIEQVEIDFTDNNGHPEFLVMAHDNYMYCNSIE